jgi:hypothetical protein
MDDVRDAAAGVSNLADGEMTQWLHEIDRRNSRTQLHFLCAFAPLCDHSVRIRSDRGRLFAACRRLFNRNSHTEAQRHGEMQIRINTVQSVLENSVKAEL